MEPDAGKHLQAARHPLPPPRPPLSPDSAPAGNRHAPRVLVLIASLLPCPFHFIPRGRENRPRLPIELFKERERERGGKKKPAQPRPPLGAANQLAAWHSLNETAARLPPLFDSGAESNAKEPRGARAARATATRDAAAGGWRGWGCEARAPDQERRLERPREAQILDTTSPANSRAGCIRKVCGLQAIFISFESTVSRLCVVVCTAVVKMNKMTACLLLRTDLRKMDPRRVK
ncbi:uncharacterized protein [Dipodomys merriami]|uniref:uncharacterized protein n=1 Tax=Dipodomys merriami TaxID=94247 RepID=UPI00384FA680